MCYPISRGTHHSNSNFLVSQLYYLDRTCSDGAAARRREAEVTWLSGPSPRRSEQHYLLVEDLDVTWAESASPWR